MSQKMPKNMEIIGNLDPKYWVQKSDPLLLMRSVPFSLGELKILDTYISRINAADDSRCTVIFTKEEYEELMGITEANYKALQKHTKGMLGKVVELTMPNKDYLQFVLFEQAEYCKNEYGTPIIKLTCTSRAKELFFCIGKYHYFKYALENVINLTRKASYLLYLYIRTNRYRGEWQLTLEELRDTVLDLKTQESYKEFKEFKRTVLDPAVKEINEKTDCHFEYAAFKRGRKISEIKFIYHSEEQLEGQLSFDELSTADPQLVDEFEEHLKIYGTEQLTMLAEACSYEFGKEEIEQISRVLVRINIPKDSMTDSLEWGRVFYLREKYAALNAESAKKARKKEKAIANRFKYLLGILERDTFHPAAY